MTHDDVLFGFRLRLFTLAEELGQRARGLPADGRRTARPTTLEAPGSSATASTVLRVRERRRPRMPNQIGPHLEQRIIAFALGHPGFGPRRISAELARAKWGGIRISEHGVWRVLRRFSLNTRSKRLALIARHADPYERKPERRAKGAATSTPPSPARRCSWTASTSAGCRARRAWSGSTRRSTSPRPTPGPCCAPPSATPRRARPPSSATWSRPS